MAVKIALGAIAALFLLAGLRSPMSPDLLDPPRRRTRRGGILAGAQILIGAIVLAVALRHAATSNSKCCANRGSDPGC